MKKLLLIGIITFSCFAGLAEAQINKKSRTAFMQHYVILDAVIENRETINLSEDQKRTIQRAVKAMQAEVSDLGWEHETAANKLERLSSIHPVDSSAVITQAQKLMDIESRLKLENLKLHITVKNTLTLKQYETLQGLVGG